MDTENSCFEKEDRETKEEDIVLFELEEQVGKSSAQFIFPPPRDSPSEWEGLRFATESPTLLYFYHLWGDEVACSDLGQLINAIACKSCYQFVDNLKANHFSGEELLGD